LEQSKVPLQRDETIIVIENSTTRQASQPVNQENAASTNNQLFKKLSLDVTVRAPGNLWIRHPDLVSEISGNLRAAKKPDAEVELTGRIDIVRGSLVFQGRRFQLTRGSIQFTGGGKINPSLDIAAEYKASEYNVEVDLTGTAQKPSLTLNSQPRLDQADILAVLLFGRPVNSLNQNQRGSVQESAVNIASGFVAGKLASSVSQALGLDTLGLDLSARPQIEREGCFLEQLLIVDPAELRQCFQGVFWLGFEDLDRLEIGAQKIENFCLLLIEILFAAQQSGVKKRNRHFYRVGNDIQLQPFRLHAEGRIGHRAVDIAGFDCGDASGLVADLKNSHIFDWVDSDAFQQGA
jgi:hypothetical protein